MVNKQRPFLKPLTYKEPIKYSAEKATLEEVSGLNGTLGYNLNGKVLMNQGISIS